MHQDRDLVRRRDLHRPLAGGTRDGDEIALQQRVGDRVPGVLLAGRHDEWRAGGVGVEQVAHPVAEPAGGVQVHEAGLAGGLRVAVGHRHDAGLLQAEHVVEPRAVGQGIDQRQFRGARITEDVLAAFTLQDVEQDVGTSAHEHRFGSSSGAAWPPVQ